jgi:hypothetical protein
MEQLPRAPLGGDQEPSNQYESQSRDADAQPPNLEALAPDAPENVVSALAAAVPAEAADHSDRERTAERRSNKDILAVAKASIDAVAEQVRRNENLPGVRALAEHFITSTDIQAPPYLLYRATAGGELDIREVRSTVADCAIFRLWSRSKVVYAMDDQLLSYLSEATATPIPTQVFGNLPHRDPYILLPQPDFSDPQTDYFRTHINVPVGAFVFGRYNQAQQLTSTADDKREDLGLMFVGFRDTDRGPDLVTLRCTIPLQGPTFTVEDAVNATIGKFQFNEHLSEDDPRKLEAWLRTYVGQAFNSLLYVCTDQPDIEEYRPGGGRGGRPAKSRERRRPRLDDVDTVVKLGFRMGPALHAARTRFEHQQGQQPGEGTGGKKRPHQKRGHYRTYWTGPGRGLPVMKWIDPFWVNESLLGTGDEPIDVVVRPVRKRR